MKKLLVLALTLLSSINTEINETHTHVLSGIVTNINDYVYVSTTDGMGWAIDGDGYNIGDNLLLVFDDMGTTDIYDDEIITVYKEVIQ